jgi:hypothetical protein
MRLVNILNAMYNDNLVHINSTTTALNNLIESNTQIRNLLVEIIQRPQPQSQPQPHQQVTHTQNNRRNQDLIHIERVIQPYVINSIGENGRVLGNRRNNTNNAILSLLENFLQPIEVYPTQTQIETATRLVRYSDISRPMNTSCPIAMDDFNNNDMVTIIRCGHIFHTEHIMNWLRTNCLCPVCRYDLREYNSNVSSNQFNTNSQDVSNNNLERNR